MKTTSGHTFQQKDPFLVLTMYVVELEGISKTFPGDVEANKDITLRIKRGEVHGLLGENGAGKSTLMNILYGLLQPSEGRIKANGEYLEFDSPQDAINKGIGMVHQHFKLIPPLTVAENIVLGSEPQSSKLTPSGIFTGGILTSFILMLLVWFSPNPLLFSSIFIGFVVLIFLILNRLDYNLEDASQRSKYVKFLLSFLNLFKIIRPVGYEDAIKKIARIAEENRLEIDPRAKVQDISVGLQQRVEIIKTLYRDADILILDEPTSVLTPQEVDELFLTLERFRDAGKTIILITHKLREPMALCDRISVLRDGELIGTVNKDETSREELAKMMVGRPVVFRVQKEERIPGNIVLSIEDLHVTDRRDIPAVKGISLDVREREIFGIAGVEGNGQSELVEAIVGLRKPTSGKIMLAGKNISDFSPRKCREAGISHIPEDRHERGLVLDFTIEENLALGKHYYQPLANGPRMSLLNLPIIASHSQELISEYSIKVQDSKSLANTLSGGNQQKVVVARELGEFPKLVIAAQPTRGLDVGATEFIHKQLIKMRDEGAAVLLVSAELDEIQALSDRIAVIFNGKLVATKKSDETTQEELGLLMAGHLEEVS
ncbi:MAG: ATP-binding cassette domain-containing protein [Candidatus Lokiarchaeota archaeon]|nr:ATP-binding cassette domain-containing protein [Candidatus Lokiarchaeota archaeon]